ncbi:MAG: hypothetical protein A2015_15640 [Spirochaetes bacterium GWF1_31_7]|nr:MAG: hypothetical protein A2Y30_01655 [Spirochaetes bacterium GWE1_32_154]OHD47053.1 MAG: hypothetical protein A2Y29_06550 [Spirochaetes bacterium GWE2_31_10]OHD53060.1 MAG: hypothetical protein A2015_15640 [Spirochaetes bacterium GWF1_31_7]HBD94820.1 peptidylprolyl isomerase [Spirochaetia bacterium]
MNTVKNGDTVIINFSGKDSSGTTFDTTFDKKPISLVIGAGLFLPFFEKAIIGMSVHQKKKIKIACNNAYGEEKKELIFSIDKNIFPDSTPPTPNMVLEFKQPDGKILCAKILSVSEKSVTVNTNHPLAGKDLFFDIELLETRISI